ncbi:MAG: MarR family transcriptional regulator [Saprospiraceae bacterium]|nr:MarR family transcriptional regulator [Saprospiraceae bacterium]
MSINQEIKQERFESEHHKMLVNLLFSADWVSHQIKEVLDQYGLTHVQYNVLRILKGSKGEPMTAGAIKEVLLFRSTDLTRLIDRLEKKELVKRGVCQENRRKVDISISARGLALLGKISPAISAGTNGYFSKSLSVEEAQTFNALLDKLRK